eukprot:scaffold10559_cov267-Chaetoceros_neogracile.AAC.3
MGEKEVADSCPAGVGTCSRSAASCGHLDILKWFTRVATAARLKRSDTLNVYHSETPLTCHHVT